MSQKKFGSTLVFVLVLISTIFIACDKPVPGDELESLWDVSDRKGYKYINNDVFFDANKDIVIGMQKTTGSVDEPTGVLIKRNRNGELLWERETAVGFNQTVSDSEMNIYGAGIIWDESSEEYLCSMGKYSSAGDEIWSNTNPAFDFRPYEMALDTNNNIIIAGDGRETDTWEIAKFSNDGIFLWSQQLPGKAYAQSECLEKMLVDTNGDIYLAGTYLGDFRAAKLDGQSGVLLWESSYDGPGNNENQSTDKLADAILDSHGNLVVTGSVIKGEESGANLRQHILTTIKYDPNGNLLWKHEYEYSGSALGSDIRGGNIGIDGNGNVIIPGAIVATTGFYPNPPGGIVPSRNYYLFILKLDSNGSESWFRTRDKDNTIGDERSVYIDKTNGIWTCGGQYIDHFNAQGDFVLEHKTPQTNARLYIDSQNYLYWMSGTMGSRIIKYQVL
ncbi:MAG: hypothetical protein GY754_15880 [bacterium]|nr:hypothetical protein [bacterium]